MCKFFRVERLLGLIIAVFLSKLCQKHFQDEKKMYGLVQWLILGNLFNFLKTRLVEEYLTYYKLHEKCIICKVLTHLYTCEIITTIRIMSTPITPTLCHHSLCHLCPQATTYLLCRYVSIFSLSFNSHNYFEVNPCCGVF